MLKKETRILGLSGTSIGRKTIVASVVFRGSLWLDGVYTITIGAKERNYNLQLGNFIMNSKQFPQLQAIIISQRLNLGRAISIQELARRVKLPVIAIVGSNKRRRIPRRGYRRPEKFTITVNEEHVLAMAAGVERDQAEKLYRIGCGSQLNVPEAVRIADLLIEGISRFSDGMLNVT